MSEKEYVCKVLQYAENTFKYLIGVISAVVGFLFFSADSLSQLWLVILLLFCIICVACLIITTVVIRKFLRKLRRL